MTSGISWRFIIHSVSSYLCEVLVLIVLGLAFPDREGDLEQNVGQAP
jgi:hypothetical protein